MRCAFEVQAGLIPGQAEPDLGKTWLMTTDDSPERFQQLYEAAADYAKNLMDPSALNWVKLEWVWF